MAIHESIDARLTPAISGENENRGTNVSITGEAGSDFGIGVQGKAVRGVVGISLDKGSIAGASPRRPGGLMMGPAASNEFLAGVYGESKTGKGVHGYSPEGIGIFGHGKLAGLFEGDVEVKGVIRTEKKLVCKSDIEVAGKVTANDHICFTGADCAEDFDVCESVDIEPGTVMVLGIDGVLRQCTASYDKCVAGVISGAGNYRPGIVLDKQQSTRNRRPIALMGKVFCKVDASYAPISIGDLLTTSFTPGYAMKAADSLKAFGCVIGKALQPLSKGQGLISVLVSLK